MEHPAFATESACRNKGGSTGLSSALFTKTRLEKNITNQRIVPLIETLESEN